MDDQLFERLEQLGVESQPDGFAISPGVVTNNLDAMAEGRVQVRIPAIPALEPWCRLPTLGGGSGRGFVWVPQIDDEVLVAFAQNDPSAAYVLGGLWSTADRPPLTLPTDFLIKRVIKTGLAGGLGHEIEFDDALQSITITSSTQQKITIDPLQIRLENTAGTLSIAMDNTTQTITVQSALKIEMKALQISLEGTQVDIKGAMVNIQSSGPCSVQGLPIKLN
ncbi:MAG: phage baseplate assembly protein V [Acidobacteriota bacterium]